MSRRRRPRLVRSFAGAICTLLLVSCVERGAIRVTETDSAGVRIVASGVRTRAVPPAFRLSAAPRLALGSGSDPNAASEPVLAGALLGSGDVTLLGSGGTLTRYGPGGEPRWERPGSALWLTAGPGDSVTVLSDGDSALVIAPDGGVRGVALGWEGPEPLSVAWSAAGGFVAVTGWSTGMLPADARPGLRSDPAHVLRFDSQGALLDTVASFPGNEVGLFELGGRVSLAPPHFPRYSLIAGAGESIVLGTGEADELRVLGIDGELHTIVRREGRDHRLAPADSSRARLFRQRLLGNNPASAQILAELDRVLPLPAVRPPYAQLLVDPDGRIWVGEYPSPGEVPATFSVYAPDGALLGQVGLPPGLRLLDVGRDAVLGAAPGAGGVVRVYDVLPLAP